MINLIFQAIFLGIIQGLTEFLPISSSAHLVFFQEFFPSIKTNAFQFDLVLHLGTILALIIFFFKDFKDILFHSRPLILKIILAVFITAIIIFPFRNLIEKIFQVPKLAGLMLLITALILFLASRKKNNKKKEIGYKEAIVVGISQAFSALPGISRSGITISSGIFSNLDSKIAFNFSFLMTVPLILGASLVELKNFTLINNNLILPYLFGFVFSFVFGLIALRWLKKMLKLGNKSLFYFSLYCLIFGILIILIV
ncbi:MAG: undecaprenyl-diphosphate phosphatase [Minisyncoccia bacterium]